MICHSMTSIKSYLLLQGYEMVSFDTVSVPPPQPVPNTDDKEGDDGKEEGKETTNKPIINTETIPTLTQQQARDALLKHVSSKCCYGSGAAKQMKVSDMEYVPAFHYELQTFIEKRETSWTYAPHKGGEVDSPARGPAPLPWDIEEKPVTMFKDEVRVVTVPHTGVVKACHKCRGTGGMVCRDCSGKVRINDNDHDSNKVSNLIICLNFTTGGGGRTLKKPSVVTSFCH